MMRSTELVPQSMVTGAERGGRRADVEVVVVLGLEGDVLPADREQNRRTVLALPGKLRRAAQRGAVCLVACFKETFTAVDCSALSQMT